MTTESPALAAAILSAGWNRRAMHDPVAGIPPTSAPGFQRMFIAGRMTVGLMLPIEPYAGDRPTMTNQSQLAMRAEMKTPCGSCVGMRHRSCTTHTPLRTSAILPALFVLASCGQSSTAPTAPAPSIVSLVGTVTARGGATLPGATVRIDDGPNAGKSVTTNDKGEYRFESLATGNGNVSAVADGYESVTTGITIDGRTPLNFSLLTSEPWSKSGTGDAVFYIPSYITRVHIVGAYAGVSASFIVHVGECAIVDDRIGTGDLRTRSEGTYLLIPAGNPPPRSDADGRVEILDSQGVSWSFTEDRNPNLGTPCYLY